LGEEETERERKAEEKALEKERKAGEKALKALAILSWRGR
jgi:hypothetical protein